MTAKAEPIDVEVAGGMLRVALHRPEGEPTLPPVLGLHGVTASSVSLNPVARALVGETLVAAPDLRGRGASSPLPGPYGMAAHADDCAAVVRALNLDRVILVGESMGGYVSVVFAARYPELVHSIVLVDGGIPLELPEGVPVEAVVQAVLGPAIERLSMTFESEAAYLDFWRVHPAVSEDWNADVEDYLRYDLVGDSPALRSRVSAAAVEGDLADQLSNPALIADSLASLRCPITLLRATRGLLNQPEPLLPDALVDPWREKLPQMSVEIVDDTNHYTLMFGSRGAERIAAAVREIA
ncbi:MAG TPA: alpha/beta hydrolase [Mycobacteriales bacterium]|nr:alpha/beta hydrolase [Mycobacteriales bacterium]